MHKRTLSPFQIFSVIAMASMLGVPVTAWGSFSPAYFWTVILIFLLQSGGLVLLCFSFGRTGKTDGSEQLSCLITAIPGRILMGTLGISLTLRSSLTLSAHTGCVSLYLLEDTPPFAVMLVLMITGFFALLPGVRRLSGVSTLLVLILPILLLLVVGVGLAASDLGELRTLAQPAKNEFADALVPAAVTASGAECALLFLGHRQSGRRSIIAASAAPAACAVIFAALSCTAVGTIGIGGMNARRFPIVEAARQINLGGIELTERFDLPLITVSLFASIVQIALFTLCAALSLGSAIGCRRTGVIALWLLPLQLVLALLIRSGTFGGVILPLCGALLTLFSVILFPLLAVISLLHRKEHTVQ